jgi:hypothetical protein
MKANSSFDKWQADYAAHGVATFPVDANKRPMVSRYDRFGLVGSSQIASKFANAPAIGFMCGKRNGITVLDVDCKDERILADALDRHGKSGVVVRSGSGNFQAWYKHNSERRRIRPDRNVPIDILGAGFVVAPPSQSAKGSYEFISGSLDDLDRLPVMANVPVEAWDNSRLVAEVKQGQRNNKLFSMCLEHARHCDDFNALLDVAVTHNREFLPPLDEGEVMRTAASAWKYEAEGRNWFGKPGVHFFSEDALPLIDNDPDLFRLLMYIRAKFLPGEPFILTNSFCERWGWSRQRLAGTRKRGLSRCDFYRIRAAYPEHPALYVWHSRRLSRERAC